MNGIDELSLFIDRHRGIYFRRNDNEVETLSVIRKKDVFRFMKHGGVKWVEISRTAFPGDENAWFVYWEENSMLCSSDELIQLLKKDFL